MRKTSIEWATSTFNPWRGCAKVSPGCTHCYAEALAKRAGGLHGTWGVDGERVISSDKYWNEPLRWNAEATTLGEPWRVFCASMADVFEDRRDLDAPRARVFDLIERTPALTWLLLTKRPENMIRLAPEAWRYAWPRNSWAGATVENRERRSRISKLLHVPAATRWLSIEPLLEDLGEVDFTGIAWAIIGGESGGGSRPFDIAWARSLIRQMRAQGVAPHVKQFGARPYDSEIYCEARFSGMEPLQGVYTKGNTLSLRDYAKGADMSEWPEDLRVREYPEAKA